MWALSVPTVPTLRKDTGVVLEKRMLTFSALPWAQPASRGWYYRGRRFLKPQVFEHRIRLLDEIIAAPVLSSGQQRKYHR